MDATLLTRIADGVRRLLASALPDNTRVWRSSVWSGTAPIRDELFGTERLELHAATLAAAQSVSTRPPAVPSLQARLKSNATTLLAAYRATAREVESERTVVPAADWLLDNYHVVDAQVREIRDDLSPGYYRQLPKLADGPFAGYPRILGIAWAYVAHTDSHFDVDILRRFISAYQRVQPLTIGELWAVAITLRIVLVENLRRLADQISAGEQSRREADRLADRLLAPGEAHSALVADINARSPRPLNEVFAAQLAKRLRDRDPTHMPALQWLEERLVAQGTSIDGVVEKTQHRLGASNVSVRNVITSMRLISDIDWTKLFESVSLVDQRLRLGSDFEAMDFPTRNSYRTAIEQLARGSGVSELDISSLALDAAALAASTASPEQGIEPVRDPGRILIGAGRRAFERTIKFSQPAGLRLSRFIIRLGIGGYAGAIVATTMVLIALAAWALPAAGLSGGWLAVLAMISLVPASEVAYAIVNRGVAGIVGARRLPGLELAEGVPATLRTLIAVPTMLTCEADLLEHVEALEVHHLAGGGGDLTYALLSDGVDCDEEVREADAPLLELAAASIARLNLQYGPGPAGDRFLFLHRRRRFNPGENVWMGWERKRGKLHELNRLLRGATDTTFAAVAGQAPHVPQNVRFVITLDADTRLPRDAALSLVGKMGHPMNRPTFCATAQRVVDGYGILQPRVTPTLPTGREGSLYQRVFSGPGGTDPYATAVSDVYQDLFGEGSYTGKAIYDIDAFEASMAGRIPQNTLLSHDLFEGVFARSGLAADIEVVEEFPARYDVAGKRLHRWIRGDWQLLPAILRFHRGRATPALGRWKMLDNLRRSLLAPALLLGLTLCWLGPLPIALVATLLLIATIAIPAVVPIFFAVLPHRLDIRLRSHLARFALELRLAAARTFLSLVFLPDHAWRSGDAIIRTLLRLSVTHRHLLEWTTAARSSASPRLDVPGFYRQMAGGTALATAIGAGALVIAPTAWPLVAPLAALWLAAPLVAHHASRSPVEKRRLSISGADARELRLIARRTWRYFETFVTPADNMLPPDNFQETPRPVLAHRTSPTNIGLYLLATAAARDFGWAGTAQTIRRLEATFETLRKLTRFRGHFLNWYGTQDLAALQPAYVSSVDSGNLAGHLIALANACDEWAQDRVLADPRQGVEDTLRLTRAALDTGPIAGSEAGVELDRVFDEFDDRLGASRDFGLLAPTLTRLAHEARRISRTLAPGENDPAADLGGWIDALSAVVDAHAEDAFDIAGHAQDHGQRLVSLAAEARAMVLEMDFTFLLDPQRELLSIGYRLADSSLDASCYDLLASEARLASLIAIAKGDAPGRHWFRLGRLAIPFQSGSVLISWSGSMFEYLMPGLVMRAPAGSMLEQTTRLVVQRQQTYARSLGIPWGVSESAYNARDIEFTYQYSNFGVPGLGLKRGLAQDAVVAPYATALASMVDPQAALKNYAALTRLGAQGRYGFHEALDFTPTRLPEGEAVAIVRCFMAHHQGMSIVATANALHDGRMRARFHREPMIMASELLLQERTPRDVVVSHPRAEEVRTASPASRNEDAMVRRLKPRPTTTPITHMLSNGRYAVMLTAAGGGYSRWRDLAVTRWREDSTRDDTGYFLFVRDTRSGETWSATSQPNPGDTGDREVVFGEDHAEFVHHAAGLVTTMEVIVSGEHNGEVRRLSVANNGWRSRDVELTSYCELVLATPAADNAHAAFSKMFVQTEYLPEFGALVATRRLRTPDEQQVWVAHFAVVEGDASADLQYETARARFFGSGHDIGSADAIRTGEPLSNTVGTVLDPIFSLRQRLVLEPGKVGRIAFWTLAAASREELLDLIDTHHDRNAFDRARTLAWTQAQVQLRHLDIRTEEAADFQRLAAPLLYADPRFRPPSEAIRRGAGPQSGLWQHSISGDLPIVLLQVDGIEHIAQVRQLLRAHEYWRMKGLGADLVIINERASSYVQDLQVAIETVVRSHGKHPLPGEGPAQGAVYALRADLMSIESRLLLQSVARIVLSARRGPLTEHLTRLRLMTDAPRMARRIPPLARQRSPASVTALPELEFFNGLGGFTPDGREYVIVLGRNAATPAPWINVVANEDFGFQVSAEGAGYTWAQNSRENQITQWSNDAVADPSGEAIYVQDDATGELWSPTARPIRDDGTYIARHGFGYSRFQHEARGIGLDLLTFVPLRDPVRISRLRITNQSGESRRLIVTHYVEWVLGTARGASAPFITTHMDSHTGAMLACNPWSTAFGTRISFADLGGLQSAWTADRGEFLGPNGSPSAPLSLLGRLPLSGKTGCGLDPCAALQTTVSLEAGATLEIVALLGQCASLEETRMLIQKYRQADLDSVLSGIAAHWRAVLGAVQVKTPDRAMDIMLNGWLLYQTLACRLVARSAFYQASGAYGFRDQLQDGTALALALPAVTRSHILRAASRQFVEGDVQHWWLPQSGKGVRTRICDDHVWLAFATASYVESSGDDSILEELVPFIDGPALRPGEHENFFQPMPAEDPGSLFEHCARGIDHALSLTGTLGMPLMGTGDWNDGMNRVGSQGRGESVWAAWLLMRTISIFSALSQTRDAVRTARWRARAEAMRVALEHCAWDGRWYRRATYDDGTWLGSRDSEECRIDSIAQSWAVLSEAADPQRAKLAMTSLEEHLIRHKDGLALLFTPPFDRTSRDPGYIKGYPVGVRENAGQYSHAAMWAVLAFAKLRDGDRAHRLFALLNPINHARTRAEVEQYKVEPYVVAADIYSVAPHVGRGGWTWYTGSAGWMYRAGLEGILGIRRKADRLVVDPCMPASWPGFTATVQVAGNILSIEIRAATGKAGNEAFWELDGVRSLQDHEPASIPIDGRNHHLLMFT